MHPAYSVILFTVSSGAGYGMLFLMSVLAVIGRLPVDPWFSWPAFVIALGLVSVGLLSSLLHLGHPERFLRALTQWRSSWLSREGVLAIGTYGPAGLFALGWLFVVADPQSPGTIIIVLALVTVVLCTATVFSTSMIYASLKPIPQWCRGDVPYGYLTLSFASGALLLNAVAALAGSAIDVVSVFALVGLVLAYAVKARYWRAIRAAAPLRPRLLRSVWKRVRASDLSIRRIPSRTICRRRWVTALPESMPTSCGGSPMSSDSVSRFWRFSSDWV